MYEEQRYKNLRDYNWYDLLTISGYLVARVDETHFDLTEENEVNIHDLELLLVERNVGFELRHANKTLEFTAEQPSFFTWMNWLVLKERSPHPLICRCAPAYLSLRLQCRFSGSFEEAWQPFF